MRSEEKTPKHTELCIATAKRFIDKVALYEYKSFASFLEQPDVLVYGEDKTTLFEIKMSIADFKADQYKRCRKKYRLPHWARHLEHLEYVNGSTIDKIIAKRETEKAKGKAIFRLVKYRPEVELVEKEHLGNYRYFVCPAGIIPVEIVPEGWGLYYYKNGKFYRKKGSHYFRSNLKKENSLIVHALRRYASGDTTGIMINTYHYRDDFGGKK